MRRYAEIGASFAAALGAVAQNAWIQLFNGRNLQGWKANVSPEAHRTVDGVLVVHDTSRTARLHLLYVGDGSEPPGSDRAKAAGYIIGQREARNRFTHDGRLKLDNNFYHAARGAAADTMQFLMNRHPRDSDLHMHLGCAHEVQSLRFQAYGMYRRFLEVTLQLTVLQADG